MKNMQDSKYKWQLFRILESFELCVAPTSKLYLSRCRCRYLSTARMQINLLISIVCLFIVLRSYTSKRKSGSCWPLSLFHLFDMCVCSVSYSHSDSPVVSSYSEPRSLSVLGRSSLRRTVISHYPAGRASSEIIKSLRNLSCRVSWIS